MANILLITLLIVGLCVLLLGFRVFFTKTHEFPSSHVDAQPALREKGLGCHRREYAEEQAHRDLAQRIKDDEKH